MKYKEVINLNKTKAEKLIERMYFLEHGKFSYIYQKIKNVS